jgi:hypothetical protein
MLPQVQKTPIWLLGLGFVLALINAAFRIFRRGRPYQELAQIPYDAQVFSVSDSLIYDGALQPIYQVRPGYLGRLYETIIKADNSSLHGFITADNRTFYIDGSTSKIIAA